MFDKYMTLYNSTSDLGPIIALALIVFIIIGRISILYDMHYAKQLKHDIRNERMKQIHSMRQLKSDIRSERKKLMHERCELERLYHMYM